MKVILRAVLAEPNLYLRVMSSTPLLEVEKLQIKNGNQVLVQDLSYSLNAGETLGLVGESGSGKTLTSFKASQIIRDIPEVKKVVFVVDRKDLDYQTIKEFNA
ncbi:MAG: DEAD/DEAH box helicase family protein, partial [Croceimicrobium sp.]